jgi:hypothetical protein
MAYTRGAYALFTSLPVPARPELHSSRSIDAPSKRYELDATTGGYESMPSTAQRVLLLISFAAIDAKFITAQEQEETRQRIIDALKVLTDGPSPAISLKSVLVGSDRTGVSFRHVTYRDLGTGIDETVQA